MGTIAGVARKVKVHRRMVREAIGRALPSPRKKTERPRWKLAGAAAFVDGILAARRPHRELPAAPANRRQVLLAHDAPIEYPDASRLAVLALHHPQETFDGNRAFVSTMEAILGAFGCSPRDAYNRRLKKAVQRFDIQQRVVLAYSYDLPFGKEAEATQPAFPPVPPGAGDTPWCFPPA